MTPHDVSPLAEQGGGEVCADPWVRCFVANLKRFESVLWLGSLRGEYRALQTLCAELHDLDRWNEALRMPGVPARYDTEGNRTDTWEGWDEGHVLIVEPSMLGRRAWMSEVRDYTKRARPAASAFKFDELGGEPPRLRWKAPNKKRARIYILDRCLGYTAHEMAAIVDRLPSYSKVYFVDDPSGVVSEFSPFLAPGVLDIFEVVQHPPQDLPLWHVAKLFSTRVWPNDDTKFQTLMMQPGLPARMDLLGNRMVIPGKSSAQAMSCAILNSREIRTRTFDPCDRVVVMRSDPRRGVEYGDLAVFTAYGRKGGVRISLDRRPENPVTTTAEIAHATVLPTHMARWMRRDRVALYIPRWDKVTSWRWIYDFACNTREKLTVILDHPDQQEQILSMP